MFKRICSILFFVTAVFMTGCASVPMATVEEDQSKKQFNAPAEGMAGLYIYRNSILGSALKKTLSVDGQEIGESAPSTFFYRDITPGQHTIATESEFSDNTIQLNAIAGENYYVKQSIKMGVFVGGADLKQVTTSEGQNGVLECKLAQ